MHVPFGGIYKHSYRGEPMPQMTDPINALKELQKALDNNLVQLTPCDIHNDISVIVDQPTGVPRFTYALVESRKVTAISLFVLTEPIEGLPCFNVGYAVLDNKRGKGIGTDILKKGIEEMHQGFARNGHKEFYIEAVVGVENHPSNSIAKKIISTTPIQDQDHFSGEEAFQYLRKLQ